MIGWWCGECNTRFETPEARDEHWATSPECEGGTRAIMRRRELQKAYEETGRA